ncbi:MAG TPA: hypothetical protein VGJ92_00395 [Methanocella sp.]|jgi:hypothetical protein
MAATGAARGARAAVVRAFAVSITMAVLMVLMALGCMSVIPHFMSGEDFSHWLMVPLGAALILFALSFVASAVLLDRSGTGQLQSVIVGAIVALGITALVLIVYAGAISVNDGTMTLENETLLAGFAIALIGSAIIDRLILKF